MDTIRKADSRRGRIAYEVAGLSWLAEASDPGAAVVSVLDHGATWLEEPRLVSVSPTPRAAEEFGRALAHTHAAGASHLGAPPPGFEGDGWMGEARLSLLHEAMGAANANECGVRIGAIGDATNPGPPASGEVMRDPAPASSSEESWGAFYARERIAPYADDRTFTAAERALIDKLCERLESGALDHGQPSLVEDAKNRQNNVGAARTPAAQGGHAEEDLGALAVFGCPHYERILAAYDEASPLEDGWCERIALHQMHIIMIHCAVFGRSYGPEAMAIARRYV